MPYQTLYRKYRPKKISDVHGQDHVVKALSNAVKEKKIAHSYIFSGWWGSGKTTTARILAAMLNCEEGITHDPCGKCKPCLSIMNGNAIDIKEIDAASNRGIDEIRKIQDESNYAPSHLRCKMYILDEAHMLTTQAANALLKIIEEPPRYMYFVLCTTEPKSILSTIHSRCERYDFKKIIPKDIADRLKFIADSEEIEVDEETLYTVARHSNGSMRDAISNMDQLIKYCGNEPINAEKAREMLGAVGSNVCFDLVNAIKNKDAPQGIKIINELVSNGVKYDFIYNEMTSHLRNMALVYACGNNTSCLGLSDHDLGKIQEQARQLKKISVITKLFDIFSAAQEGIAMNINQQLVLEMTLIKSIVVVNRDGSG